MPHRLSPRLFLCAVLLTGAWPVRAAKPSQPAPVDPLEASIAGEFALQGGQLPDAARRYLQAARSASDPVLAERATRIALLATEDALRVKVFPLDGPDPQRARLASWRDLALRAGESGPSGAKCWRCARWQDG